MPLALAVFLSTQDSLHIKTCESTLPSFRNPSFGCTVKCLNCGEKIALSGYQGLLAFMQQAVREFSKEHVLTPAKSLQNEASKLPKLISDVALIPNTHHPIELVS
ncbi:MULTISPECIES: hypothetical protein [Legionella]|uniref:hypothetical protein n=1 Tax=Legionella TaxID=445 RepID=UPI000F8DE0B8|nr:MULTISPECIES: hypothetical protein [Legionella]MCP0914959.1 hypothetical protein [Legionella sp. 27cVA30]RUQ93487.1 hypothetical protein ELY11_11905 [Legionella septentrionalis]RUR10033.1 hypothetical protein ELY14_06595 [Legionella septentrionalis]